MMDKKIGFEEYSNNLKRVFEMHKKEVALSCLMKNHHVWKMSFGVVLQYMEDFPILKDKLGLKDGDRVLIYSDTTVDSLLTFLVLSTNHLTCVMADANIPEEELIPLIKHSNVSAIFADIKNSKKMAELDIAPVLLTYGLSSSGKLVYEYNGKINKGEATPNTIAMLFSSGTTASRKCVELSYQSFYITHDKFKKKGVLNSEIPYRPMLEVFPMSHVAGLISAYTMLNEGGSVAMIEQLNSDAILEAFKKFKPFMFGMVPKVNDLFINKFEEKLKQYHLYGIYSRRSRRSRKAFEKTGNLKKSRRIMSFFRSLLFNKNFSCLFSGGAIGSASTMEKIQNMGIAYIDAFASTECGIYICCTEPNDPHCIGSVGNVNGDPYTEIKINNPNEEGIGEIYVKTDQIMNGYYFDEKTTEEAFDGEYFKTGDLGRIDENGYLYITGRIKESILMPNGNKVAPNDMEKLLTPVMKEGINYAIVGVPQKSGADQIHLFIENKDLSSEEASKLKEDILKYQFKAMNQYRLTDIHFIDAIPTTSIGKPKRYLLKDMVLNEKKSHQIEDKIEETIIEEDKVKTPMEDGAKEVEKKIFEIVKRISKYSKEIKGPEKFKETLGMDSLSLMEMCSEVESIYPVNISAVITIIPNPRELVEYIVDPFLEEYINKKVKQDQSKVIDPYLFPAKRKALQRFLFNHYRKWTRRKMDFQVEGLDNVKEDKIYIFCPNHETHFDGLFVWTALGKKCPDIDHFGCMAKAEHLDHTITKLMMTTLGGIPVIRTGNTIDSTHRSINYIKEGNYFLIHPEGTRTRNGKLGPFKCGAAKIALDSGVSIIPVAIKGGYEIWPYNQTLPKCRDEHHKKKVLRISFLEEVVTLGRNEEEITEEIRNKITKSLEN